jgi:type IV pilus assembly protein PilX
MTRDRIARGGYRAGRAGRAGNRGVILIVGLLFLLAITLLSLAMVRGVGQQEKTAGNTRDKERSFEAAQSALEFGEWWVATSGHGTFSVACTTPNRAVTSLVVCSNPLATPPEAPWPAWTTYKPSTGMNVQAGGGVGANGDVNYQAAPGLYVSYIGQTPDSTGVLYRVTAFSGGGAYETLSVVQSTYKLSTNINTVTQP